MSGWSKWWFACVLFQEVLSLITTTLNQQHIFFILLTLELIVYIINITHIQSNEWFVQVVG